MQHRIDQCTGINCPECWEIFKELGEIKAEMDKEEMILEVCKEKAVN